ncbi:S-layer homology domain-containing protein [Acaryochloris sp. 'Moss Beach']|uniref:S-layer homology domain-containing protein n=1 Tax=Acaryochloris sp. 'Moss Beach' TaxID=2740837 RepID=UPI001F351F8B|nr:S-layer homology domain-containing protein [Acaryochloris sp. 'Moss Beach']UJB70443.1 S-layer homology domain-containing protein [Acaryochloris sp. 'Moss Beach']
MLRVSPQLPRIALAWGVSLSTMAPLFSTLPASAQTNFSDVSLGYWARPFIEKLAEKNVIKGFPDGTFKPDQPVTRAQFAAIVRQAFDRESTRQYRGFADVPTNHWAQPAIDKAYSTRFLSGYPGNLFQPNQRIPKVQALVALASGLELEPDAPTDEVLATFRDAADIPGYADKGITASTEAGLVVNYPNANFLNPNQQATRAEIAAFVYQALVDQGDLEPIPDKARANNYIVKLDGTSSPGEPSTPINTGSIIASGSKIPVRYPGPNKVNLIVAPGETVETTLEVAEDIANAAGTVLIPKGSLIEGTLVPVNVGTTPGTQFVAKTLKVGTRTYDMRASSDPQVAVSRQSVKPNDIKGAISTAAGRTILNSVLGSGFNLGSLLTGALLSGVGTSPSAPKDSVIVVDPASLELTIQAGLDLTT